MVLLQVTKGPYGTAADQCAHDAHPRFAIVILQNLHILHIPAPPHVVFQILQQARIKCQPMNVSKVELDFQHPYSVPASWS